MTKKKPTSMKNNNQVKDKEPDAWIISDSREVSLRSWNALHSVTGALAVFESKKKALAAIQYNQLVREDAKRWQRKYYAVPVSIVPFKSPVAKPPKTL